MKHRQIEIKWALIFIAVTLLWMLLERVSGLHDQYIAYHPYVTNLFAIPAIILFVLAIREKKQQSYKGQMTFRQGFISGLIITAIVTITSPLVQYLTSTFITPHYFENAIQYAVTNGLQTRAEAEGFFNLNNYLAMSISGAAMMGAVTAAIVAFFARTKN